MKKLIIAAAISAFGVVANAAVAEWIGMDIYTNPGAGATSKTFAEDYLVYFVDAGTYSYENAQTDIAKGDISFLNKEGVYAQVGNWDDVGVTDTYTASRYENLEEVAGYVVVLDSTSIDSAKNVYLSGVETDSIGGTGQNATLEFDLSGTQTGNNWQSVPEPTSGLLLLLGVAGLALKRKRA